MFVVRCSNTVHGFYHSSYNVTEGETLLTTFGPNVKGVSRFPALGFPGTITVVEDTASKMGFVKTLYFLSLCVSFSIYVVSSPRYSQCNSD